VDDWWPQGTGEPAVGASYTFAPSLYERLSDVDDFLDRLAESDYSFAEWGGWVRCWRTKPLATFLNAGSSVDLQARAVAKWGRDSIEGLAAIDPEPLDPETSTPDP
jgi:hypothetical protein